jgi:hypothetical protein
VEQTSQICGSAMQLAHWVGSIAVHAGGLGEGDGG